MRNSMLIFVLYFVYMEIDSMPWKMIENSTVYDTEIAALKGSRLVNQSLD